MNNMRNEMGKKYFYDGRIYIGEFTNGNINGYGTMYYPDGKIQEGKFRHQIRIVQEIIYEKI